MDPLSASLHDVHELILQHLSPKDVLRCTQVSSAWNEAIGSSHKCMKDVWFKIGKPPSQIELLESSVRQYQNFRIQPGGRKELSVILENFPVRNAVITDDHDRRINYRDYYDFMKSMAPTVEQFQPGEGDTNGTVGILIPIDFPRLKELQATVVSRETFSVFLGSNPRLEKVLLSFNGEVPSDLLVPNNIIHVFFQRNPQLKTLFMCEVDCAFQTDITHNVTFDLKSFAFAKTNSKFTENVSENLVKFIKLQTSLEWLKIIGLHDWNVFIRIWTEARFKKLFIMDCSLKGAIHGHELPTNCLINEINFYLNPSCHILKFLRATPNLKAFKVRQLSKQLMEFAAQSLPKLETIQFQSIESNVRSFYDDLKASSSDDDVNCDILIEEMDFFEFVGRDAGF